MRPTFFKIILFLSLSLAACKDNRVDNPNSIEMVERTLSQDERPLWERDIKLDNGDQWHANSETTEGVRSMSQLIAEFRSESAEDYRELGRALADEKDELIQNCTMKGPSHDNLHVYLQPLITKIAELEQVQNPQEGQRLVAEINNHLNAYHRYFV